MWSDLDSAAIRAALRTLEMSQLPVRYLDGHDTPMKYKLRKIPGEPVSLDTLRAMEAHPEAPWEVRDKLLNQNKKETKWTQK